MSRPNKIWFRKDIRCWMVTIGGKRIRLAEGRENKKQAQQKFHELAAERPKAPESLSARVADVIEAFLAWTKIHRSEETNRNYFWFGQAFTDRMPNVFTRWSRSCGGSDMKWHAITGQFTTSPGGFALLCC
jgi:hypothetical protein